MRKIISFCIISILLMGCSSNDEITTTCTLNTGSSEYITQVTYVYTKSDEILSMTSYSEYYFSEEDLTNYTLDEVYAEFVSAYEAYMNITGVTIEIKKDEDTNMISESICLDIETYDFNVDAFGVGTKEDYSSMADVFTMINATDAITCE